MVIATGLAWDMQWHSAFPTREYYFIPPHVAIYAGIAGMLCACFMYRLYGFRMPIKVFLLYPLLSLFDEFWHRTYGIELATSPMMFWSPAHWSFTVVTWYILYQIYKTKSESNEYITLLMRTLLFYFLPIRLLAYILIPLAPFSQYAYLHTVFNIVIPILLTLFSCTAYALVQQKDILLPGTLLLGASFSGPFRFFFAPSDGIFNVLGAYRPLFLLVFLICVTDARSRWTYMLLAYAVVFLSVCIGYLQHTLVWHAVLYWMILAPITASIYFDLEQRLIVYMKHRLHTN
jgi:hypothetical protein